MKKVLLSFAVAALMSSCATVGPMGAIYQDTNAPVTATSNSVGSKVGTSKSVSILGLIATGDAGINAAAKDGGIKKISHVDSKAYSILGIFSTSTTTVYGE